MSAVYPFLSKPPQKQKKRPVHLKPVAPVNIVLPLPTATTSPVPVTTRRRSATSASIATWTAAVQPGSPAALSPVSLRRGSITHVRVNSSSSLLQVIDMADSPKRATKLPTLQRIRSFGVLRRPRSGSNPSSPTSPTTRTRSKSINKTKPNLPPTLTNEVLLLQFMNGGTMESNMKRLMKKQAKRAAKNAAAASSGPAVSDAYRDGKGGYWRDQDEEMEYAPLVPSAADAIEDDWVRFDGRLSLAPAVNVDVSLSASSTAEIGGFADSFVPEPQQKEQEHHHLAAPIIKKKKSRKDVRTLFNSD